MCLLQQDNSLVQNYLLDILVNSLASQRQHKLNVEIWPTRVYHISDFYNPWN